MNGNRTNSILERAPEILAVTAASYGLSAPHRAHAHAGRDRGNAPRRAESTSASSRAGRETGPRSH
jgi:hypothetical protein